MVQASTSAAFIADKVMAGTVIAMVTTVIAMVTTVIAMVMVAATVATAASIATAGAINPMGRAFAFKPTGAGATEPPTHPHDWAPLSRGAFFIGGHVQEFEPRHYRKAPQSSF